MVKNFKKILEFYNIFPDGTRKNIKRDNMNYVHSQLQKSLGFDNVVEVSDLFHSNYKKSENYVSVTGKKDLFANKKIRNLMTNKNEMEYPSVEVCEMGKIKFKEGSTRYAMSKRLFDNKKVAMSKISLENCKKHGYI